MHIPVLLHEVIDQLQPQNGETVLDCNMNRAGHSKEIAKHIGVSGHIIGIDLDANALNEAMENLSTLPEHPRIHLMHSNFRNLDTVLTELQVSHVDKVLFDLGLSSQELDESGRGFTFQKDEPLIMTFHNKPGEEIITAKDIVNLWSEETLADIIYFYSDERFARRIARAIVDERIHREIQTTGELAQIIHNAVPAFYRNGKTDCATKTFQAIRIAVNDEIGAIKEALPKAMSTLRPGGRMAVITFHSLEDRVVKELFREFNKEGHGKILTKKPIVPGREEVTSNPRSRSAKLRVIEKL